MTDTRSNKLGVQEFYTVKQLASMLQIGEMTVYRMVRRGELRCLSIGRALRFHRSDVEAFLEHCRGGKATEPERQASSAAHR